MGVGVGGMRLRRRTKIPQVVQVSLVQLRHGHAHDHITDLLPGDVNNVHDTRHTDEQERTEYRKQRSQPAYLARIAVGGVTDEPTRRSPRQPGVVERSSHMPASCDGAVRAFLASKIPTVYQLGNVHAKAPAEIVENNEEEGDVPTLLRFTG